jgi:hypothetical protein
MSRKPPELLTTDESKELLKHAEQLLKDLLENRLGGFSDGNRPFWIMYEFRTIIEKFGHRDTGMHWTGDQIAALAKESKQ